MKRTAPLEENAPRTARARSERDIGSRSKRPPRGQRSSSKPRREETSAEARPRSTGGDRPRQTRNSGGSPRRPREVSAGTGARLLAPLALIVFAFACFVVVTSQSSDGSLKSSSTKASTTKAAAAAAARPTRSTYRVKAGDSFAAIAEKMNVDVNTLQQLNPDIDPRALQPGQKLKLK